MCSKEFDMNEDQHTFGKQLKKLRHWKGKSQQEVAEELSANYAGFAISQTNISHLERRREAPRQELLSVLADYYGVSLEFFFQNPGDSYEERKPRIGQFLDSLAVRADESRGLLFHTDDNSSGDKDTLDTTSNLRKWYSDIESEEE